MSLPGFERTTFTADGVTREVYQAGHGPAVLVIHEIPGVTPEVAAFARRVVDRGFTAYLPSLVGTPGRAVSPGYVARSITRACVSREFAMFATRTTSEITTWVRALGRHAHARCGGPGIGAVGMCLTGGFALAMMADAHLLAPVLSQPSLPIGVTAAQRRDLGIDDATLATVRARAAAGTCVMGLRFTGDRLVPAERFARLREELGERFLAVEIDSMPGNPHGIPRIAHSVLTNDLVDTPGHPTLAALEGVLRFFEERLRAA
jgi:dienelactone hydrolase